MHNIFISSGYLWSLILMTMHTRIITTILHNFSRTDESSELFPFKMALTSEELPVIALSFSFQKPGTLWCFYISILSSFPALRLPVLKQLSRLFKRNGKFSFWGLEAKLFFLLLLYNMMLHAVLHKKVIWIAKYFILLWSLSFLFSP